jgi:hypothetical protein
MSIYTFKVYAEYVSNSSEVPHNGAATVPHTSWHSLSHQGHSIIHPSTIDFKRWISAQKVDV